MLLPLWARTWGIRVIAKSNCCIFKGCLCEPKAHCFLGIAKSNCCIFQGLFSIVLLYCPGFCHCEPNMHCFLGHCQVKLLYFPVFFCHCEPKVQCFLRHCQVKLLYFPFSFAIVGSWHSGWPLALHVSVCHSLSIPFWGFSFSLSLLSACFPLVWSLFLHHPWVKGF